MFDKGEKIGRYQVVRLIGRGGMGEVYEAVDPEIERRAAIKLLHPQFSDNAQMATRFLNEARAVNIIQHPSLVAAFEFGRLDSGAAYIVMEYLEGDTLRQRLQRTGPLGLDALRIARQITSALCAAHAKHIVHRDLKPSKVFPSKNRLLLSAGRRLACGWSHARESHNMRMEPLR